MIQKPQQQPDTQGNSKNGLPDGDLPMGSVTEGMTDAALGDCDRDCLDGSRGYHKVGIGGAMADQREGDELTPPPMQPGGFAGRPGGWER